jgi:hypothetical protein
MADGDDRSGQRRLVHLHAGTGVAVLAIIAALTLTSSSDSRASVEVKPAEKPIA